jgi:hypothetical protein
MQTAAAGCRVALAERTRSAGRVNARTLIEPEVR